MFKIGVLFGTTLSALLILAEQSAFAGSPITVQTDQTQMIALSAEAGTVVVGNPSIADVSVNGKQVFLHGRAFGDTNVMILDLNGNQLANFDVNVIHEVNNQVAIYSSTTTFAARYTYSCNPTCQRVMIPGDEHVTYQYIVGDNDSKTKLATGNKTKDVTGQAPPAQ